MKRARRIWLLAVAALTLTFGPRPMAAPSSAPRLSDADTIIREAIARDELPGAVFLVGHRGHVVYRKAYGWRALVPRREPMTVDTIFDLASLTKVVATTPAVMMLFEQGKLRLDDPVARYLPEFGTNGKEHITIRQLLTHTSGLRPDPVLPPGTTGTEAVLRIIYADHPVLPPGMQFLYSDCNFIVLGELVHRLSGMRLDRFAERYIFRPLGMYHTRFLPPAAWRPRIAPTEEVDLPEGAKPGSGRGHLLRGVVHDPTARAMGGVAGHAGLFSTADDLAIFCRMMLLEGRFPASPARRLLAAATIHKMITPQTPPWVVALRGLGWDLDSPFSANRGELFPLGSYGHTGFTGTSIWIDPRSQTFVILLANSVHPYRRPALSSLRSRIATLVAAALGAGDTTGLTSPLERSAGSERPYGLDGIFRHADQTLAGIDVLEQENFAPLVGHRVGLITNQTGRDRQGRRTIDVLFHAPGVRLVAIFSPEHGIEGRAEGPVSSSRDEPTGLPVYSLYGSTRRPTDRMLQGIDTLVFDIQDAGVRFYTYITTMGYAMEEAASHHLRFIVLDRPNPLGGERIEGPILDADRTSFTGYFPLPVIHGMTVGELARLFNEEKHLGVDLTVVQMKDWHRRDTFEATGLPWIPPSPNLRTLNQLLLYPGIEILQAGGVSVGRGTSFPFEVIGAPWIQGNQLAEELNRAYIPGVRFVPTRFTPEAGIYRNQLCEGVAIVITDRASVFPMLMGMAMAATLHRLYPQQFALDRIIELVGSRQTLEALEAGQPPAQIVESWQPALDAFRALRAKYLLYP